MTRGEPDPEVIRRHLAALREALSNLRPIAGLRNVLVHGYLQVDLAILERVLNERLEDLEEFAGCVEAHLARA